MKTVPCKHCETPTPMTGTEMCNRCWELDTRIRHNPELAVSIIEDLGYTVEPPRIHHKSHCKLFPDPCDERDPVGPCTCGAIK